MFDDWLILLTFIFARVAGLMMTAPIFGTSAVPLQLRVFLTAALVLLLAPLEIQARVPAPLGSPLNYLLLLACEAAIGACLGLGVLVLIHGLAMAGEMIAQTSGLGIAEVFDPASGENVPLFSHLFFLVAVSVFLCLGGHRLVMAGLLDTFRAIPPGSGAFPRSLSEAFTTLVGQSFALGVRAAAPAVTALLLATLILGFIGRTLPQVNILAVGFGLNSLVAFAAIALALGTAAWALEDQIQPALEILFDAVKTPLKMEWFSP